MEERSSKMIKRFQKRFKKETGLDLFIAPIKRKQNAIDTIILLDNCIREARGHNVKSKSKSMDILTSRQVFLTIARNLGYTYTSIAKYLNRNHSSIMHSYRRTTELLEISDIQFTEAYNDILKKFNDTRNF